MLSQISPTELRLEFRSTRYSTTAYTVLTEKCFTPTGYIYLKKKKKKKKKKLAKYRPVAVKIDW